MRFLILFPFLLSLCFGQSSVVFTPWTLNSFPSTQSSWSPTNITRMAYYWDSTDLDNLVGVSNLIDRIQGKNMKQGNIFSLATNHPWGIWFSGGTNSGPYTNTAISIPSNFTYWVVVNGAYLPNTPTGGGGSQHNDACLLMDETRQNGFDFHANKFSLFNAGPLTSYTANFAWAQSANTTNIYNLTYDIVWANGQVWTNAIKATSNAPPTGNLTSLTSIGSDSSHGNAFTCYLAKMGIWTNYSLTSNDVLVLDTWVHTNDAININSGLVGWWRMDEASGTNFVDSINGLNGWLVNFTNGSGSYVSGQVSNAVSFNVGATNQYGIIPNSSAFCQSLTNGFSVTLWGKSVYGITGVRSGDPKFMFGNLADAAWPDARYKGWQMRMDDGTFNFAITDGTNFITPQYATSPMNDGGWHFCVAVYDGVGTNSIIYFDGLENGATYLANGQPGTNIVIDSTWTNDLRIAWSGTGQTLPSPPKFSGSIDDIRIYNRPITPVEVMKIYKWGIYKKNYQ